MNFIRFGRFLEEGITLYQRKEYLIARDLFGQALSINSHDFAANFWLARTFIRLGDYIAAKELLSKCRELKPQVTELLVVPWEELADRLDSGCIVTSSELENYDTETDDQLEKCYYKKDYSGRQIVIISLIFMVLGFFNAFKGWGKPVSSISLAIATLAYFHYSTLLPLNLWLRYKQVKAQIHSLFSISSFWQTMLVAVFFPSIYVLSDTISIMNDSVSKAASFTYFIENHPLAKLPWILSFISGLFAPIGEELVFRLAWYNFLAKYNKYLAYIGVAALFALVHPPMAALYVFTSSIIWIWFYNKYQTIMAPIIVHFFSNVIAVPIFFLQLRMLQW